MIPIGLNKADFEYDLYALTKAFYPRETPQVFYPPRVSAEVEGGRTAADVIRRGCSPETMVLVTYSDACIFACLVHGAAAVAETLLRMQEDAEREFRQVQADAEKIFRQMQSDMGEVRENDETRAEEGDGGRSRLQDGRSGRSEEGDWGISRMPNGWIGFADTDSADRIETKNRLKRLLYRIYARQTGQELPWGSLNGVRPGKIPMGMLAKGATDEEIHRHMRRKYLASEEKIALITEVARRERDMLSRMQGDPLAGYSLYVGIPFCPSTCLYCSFTSYPAAAWGHRMDAYLDALETELQWTAQAMDGRRLDTIYIGGGTPTTLSPAQLTRLCGMVRRYLDLSKLLEWTAEAGRPDSITPEKLAALKAGGVTRISVNPQTMKAETLRLIGRAHTPGQTVEAFHRAREAGFDSINMDIILGLPEETAEDVTHTLNEIAALEPDDLTVHSLAIKRSSRLRIEWDRYEQYVMENSGVHMALAAEAAASLGMKPYYLYRQKNIAGNQENIGYAKPGKEGLYNILIMEELQSIVALGAGSISKRVYADGQTRRCENVKDVELYIARIKEMTERKAALFS